jgi:hypothetical protein
MNNELELQLQEEEIPVYYNVSTMRAIEDAYQEYLSNKEYE